MVRVLLDACVLSELQRPQGSAQVRARVDASLPEELYISAVTFGELVNGIALLQTGPRKDALSTWLLGLEQFYGDRILPVDTEVARRWGAVTAQARSRGVTIPAADGLIAATALRHGLHLMTRNGRHFAATGVPVIDPWEAF
jgi:predicted nucleic acid-binding protein